MRLDEHVPAEEGVLMRDLGRRAAAGGVALSCPLTLKLSHGAIVEWWDGMSRLI